MSAICDNAVKFQTRQWTIDAGLVNARSEGQCKIAYVYAYEPDCALLVILKHVHSSREKDSEQQEVHHAHVWRRLGQPLH